MKHPRNDIISFPVVLRDTLNGLYGGLMGNLKAGEDKVSSKEIIVVWYESL